MSMFFLFMSILLSLMIMALFYLLGVKQSWESKSATSFECGFSSYFYSRFSFSIHYFLVGLIFLFLDLELSFVMPFMMESPMEKFLFLFLFLFLLIILMGLMAEWKEGQLEWKH